jgi:long-subunit acyl-CoA synthetase (AMP-forming)
MRAGEYIAPEMIEGALRKAGAVQQVFVHGEPGASALVAVAVPSEAAELGAAPAARAAVLDAMRNAGRQAGLKARGAPAPRWHCADGWRCMMSMPDAC